MRDELFAITVAADESNVLEEEIANRIAIKFLVEEDASEKRKFVYASDIVEGPGESNTQHSLFSFKCSCSSLSSSNTLDILNVSHM